MLSSIIFVLGDFTRYDYSKIIKKKVGKSMSLCYTVGYKWVTVMDGVKFEFNDIIIIMICIIV